MSQAGVVQTIRLRPLRYSADRPAQALRRILPSIIHRHASPKPRREAGFSVAASSEVRDVHGGDFPVLPRWVGVGVAIGLVLGPAVDQRREDRAIVVAAVRAGRCADDVLHHHESTTAPPAVVRRLPVIDENEGKGRAAAGWRVRQGPRAS